MVQIVRQTWQERYDMYMQHTKEELASMLAEQAKYINRESCAEFADDDRVNSTTYWASTNID